MSLLGDLSRQNQEAQVCLLTRVCVQHLHECLYFDGDKRFYEKRVDEEEEKNMTEACPNQWALLN